MSWLPNGDAVHLKHKTHMLLDRVTWGAYVRRRRHPRGNVPNRPEVAEAHQISRLPPPPRARTKLHAEDNPGYG